MTYPPPSGPPRPHQPPQPQVQPPYAGPQTPYGGPVGTYQYPYAGNGGPHYPPGMSPPTDGMAIAALVCGVVAGPVGLVLGLVALERIRRSGAKGRGLAITGIVLGGLSIVAAVLLVVIAATGGFDSSPENITKERTIAADALEPGHCTTTENIDSAGERVTVVPCGDAHDVEIIGDVGTEADFLGGESVDSFAQTCAIIVSAHVVVDVEHVEARLLPVIPGDPEKRLLTRYLCAAVTPDATITGSFVVGDAVIS